MEHFDYKDAMKVFAFIYKHKNILNFAKIGKTLMWVLINIKKALKWLFSRSILIKSVPYVAAFTLCIVIPSYFFSAFASGCCVSVLYLLKTQNIWGFIGLMLLFVFFAFVGSYCLYKATPKIKIRLTITEV